MSRMVDDGVSVANLGVGGSVSNTVSHPRIALGNLGGYLLLQLVQVVVNEAR